MNLQALWSSMPFTAVLGADLQAADRDEVRATLAWDARLCTAGGVLHGGALMALADSCGALAAYLNLPSPDAATSTIESGTHLLRAVREGTVTATARPLHTGRTTIVVETEVRDDAGRLVAKTSQTQAVLAPR